MDYHPNGNIHFKIGFVNGFRDGNFTFWQDNELKLLTGSFKKGKRHGLFTAYGKTGELVYQKEFIDGELEGEFKLYYPSSPSDVLRYFEKLKYEGMDPGELEVVNHLRLAANFKDGKPVGSYKAYYHPKGKKLTIDELLREEGSFDQNGKLSSDQYNYYPQTHAIAINMPDKKRLNSIYPASSDGFSRAIDEATKEIKNIPSYRNPNNEPALVYAIDERGNEITPIWSTHIEEIAIRNVDGYLLSTRFGATYEEFVFDAMNLADETIVANLTDIPQAEMLEYERSGTSVQIVGLDKNGVIIDILWSSNPLSDVIPLDERIDHKRTKLKRSWREGASSEANWLLSNGSRITIKESPNLANSNPFLKDN